MTLMTLMTLIFPFLITDRAPQLANIAFSFIKNRVIRVIKVIFQARTQSPER